MAKWEKLGGVYAYNGEKFKAFIDQQGEFWVNKVYLDGKLVDFGIWDSRDSAFRNCNGAMKKLRIYHTLERFAKDPFDAIEDIDDE